MTHIATKYRSLVGLMLIALVIGLIVAIPSPSSAANEWRLTGSGYAVQRTSTVGNGNAAELDIASNSPEDEWKLVLENSSSRNYTVITYYSVVKCDNGRQSVKGGSNYVTPRGSYNVYHPDLGANKCEINVNVTAYGNGTTGVEAKVYSRN